MNFAYNLASGLALLALGAGAIAQGVGQPNYSHGSITRLPPTPETIAAYQMQKDARAMMEGGRLARAAGLLEQALDYFGPRDDSDLVQLGVVYTRLGKTEDVLRVLHPVIYPDYSGFSSGYTNEPSVRMMYVLALLDKNRWKDAVEVYEPTITTHPTWLLNGINVNHKFAEIHFSPKFPEYSSLRAQAHLILGARVPVDMDTTNVPENMLGHLKMALKYNPNSADAHLASGYLLTQANRLTEARTELEAASKTANYESQQEISAVLADVAQREHDGKLIAEQKAANEAAGAAPKQ